MHEGRLRNHTFWATIGQLAARGAPILASIVLARELSEGAFAAFAYFLTTSSLLATYATLGLAGAALRLFAEEQDEDDLSLLSMLLLMTLVVAALAAGVVVVLPGQWLVAGLDFSKPMLAAAVLVLVPDAVSMSAAQGLQRFRAVTIVSLLGSALTIVGSVVAAVQHSASLAILTLVIAGAARTVGQLLIIGRCLGWQRLLRLRRITAPLRRLGDVAGASLLTSLLAASGPWLLGRMLLEAPLGAAAFARFSIGLHWFSLALFLPNIVARVVMPEFVKGFGAGRVEEARALVRRTLWVVVVAGVALALLGFVASPLISVMYGENYDVGGVFLALFLIAAIPITAAQVASHALVAHDKQWSWLAAIATWFCLLLVLAEQLASEREWGSGVALLVANTVLAGHGLLLARRHHLV